MKDPAILFYTSDFLTGTAFFTDEQRGQYIRLLCEQHQNGHIPENHMVSICFSLASPVVKKFIKDSDGNYYNEQGKEQPMIIMDRDGFSLLVMGFTGKEALKFKLDFINAFNEMEKRMQALPTTPEEMLLQSVQLMVEQRRKLYEVENRVKAIEAKTATTPDYFAVMGYASLNGIQVGLNLAAQIGRRAKKICIEKGYPVETIPDPRFGRVHTYPYSVLEAAFKQTTI